jgi:sugar phosphate isomerase/epimerase
MSISRRRFLKTTAAGAAATYLGTTRLAAARVSKSSKIPLGLQLYSVRRVAQKDLASVLKAVAKMGYQAVEFAGYYGHSAQQIKELLDANDLKCCGTHLRLDALADDKLEETVAFNKTIGNKYLVVSWMPPNYQESVKSIEKMAEKYNGLAETLASENMLVGYHAHGHDFHKVDGRPAWDIFFENTDPRVIMQLDIGNCLAGGGDPIATLKRFPGRTTTIHLKEHGGPAEAVIGEGDVDWEKVFALCKAQGGTDWYIVEHERGAGDPLENVERCLKNIRKIRG